MEATLLATSSETTIGPIENALIRGDLSLLNTGDRSEYYNSVCKSLGLNPLTRPFDYITLNGKLTLYARRDAADQLRHKHGVSIEIVSRTLENDILTVHVRASTAAGRRDEDFGCVYVPPTLKGESRANLELKAVTKGKRRVTLSICGLGWMDETEVEDIPAGAHRMASYQMIASTLENASQQGYEALRKVWTDLNETQEEAFASEKERLIAQARIADKRRNGS